MDDIWLARRLVDAFATWNTDTDDLAEYVAANVVDHNAPAGSARRREGLASVIDFYSSWGSRR